MVYQAPMDRWFCLRYTLTREEAKKNAGVRSLPHTYSVHVQKDTKTLERWCGRKDWAALRELNSLGRVQEFVKRFKKELE